MTPAISITYPLFGAFDVRALEASAASALAQPGPDLEIVIAEEGPVPRAAAIARRLGVKYSHNIGRTANRSEIRNRALTMATGPWIYVCDADIVFHQTDFFERLTRATDQNPVPLRHVRQRRLPKPDVTCWLTSCDADGIDRALAELRPQGRYLTRASSRPFVVHERTLDGQSFTIDHHDFESIDPALLNVFDPTRWHHVIHFGSVFARREDLLAIGGFCETYTGWGFEDVDLQWKLEKRCGMRSFPDDLEVVHLDHPKSDYSRAGLDRNGERYHRRRARGLEACLAEDRANLVRHLAESENLP